jgi:hypothetical protein
MMNRMMDRMIKNMSVQEKEEMMLKMMPIMMKDVDMAKLAPRMMPKMGKLLNVHGIVTFISSLLKDEVLKAKTSQLFAGMPVVMGKMKKMMSEMKPAMSSLMSGMMNFMAGKVMPTIAPVMGEMMPTMMKEHMPQVLEKNAEMREHMPHMMMEVMPHCVANFTPMMKEPDREKFLKSLDEAIKKNQ